VVAVPFDQRPRDPSRVFVPFFAVPAATSSGLARLALASNAPVFPVVLVREGETLRHRAIFLPAIPLVHSGDREQDVVTNTARFNLALEGLVREHPEQWIWMYHRWKEHVKGRVTSERRAPGAAAAPPASTAAWPHAAATSDAPLSADRTP
jgi:KDO2-lipid IV(A) lauroyltransferase